jgi:hypothetical protein
MNLLKIILICSYILEHFPIQLIYPGLICKIFFKTKIERTTQRLCQVWQCTGSEGPRLTWLIGTTVHVRGIFVLSIHLLIWATIGILNLYIGIQWTSKFGMWISGGTGKAPGIIRASVPGGRFCLIDSRSARWWWCSAFTRYWQTVQKNFRRKPQTLLPVPNHTENHMH